MNKMHRNKFNKGDEMLVLQDFKTLNNKIEHDTKYMEILCSGKKKRERERERKEISCACIGKSILLNWP